MKKLLIISLLLCGAILTGCSQQKGLSQDELFQKKQECISYKDRIETEIKNDFRWPLDEIFYSPKVNSCIYTTKYYVPDNGDICRGIYDYISHQELENRCRDPNDYNFNSIAKMIEDTITELKGE